MPDLCFPFPRRKLRHGIVGRLRRRRQRGACRGPMPMLAHVRRLRETPPHVQFPIILRAPILHAQKSWAGTVWGNEVLEIRPPYPVPPWGGPARAVRALLAAGLRRMAGLAAPSPIGERPVAVPPVRLGQRLDVVGFRAGAPTTVATDWFAGEDERAPAAVASVIAAPVCGWALTLGGRAPMRRAVATGDERGTAWLRAGTQRRLTQAAARGWTKISSQRLQRWRQQRRTSPFPLAAERAASMMMRHCHARGTSDSTARQAGQRSASNETARETEVSPGRAAAGLMGSGLR